MFHLSDLDLSLRDGLWLGLLAPVCLYLAWQVYRTPKQGFRLARWLLVIRSTAFLLLLALMMEPVLALTMQRERKPLVAVLVDDSESMRIEDNGRKRGDLAIDLLKSDVFDALESRARLARYRFSEWLGPLPPGGADSLRFDGRATDLAAALDLLGEETAGEGLAAAVLISDGAHNLGARPERAALGLGAPVFAVGVGNPEAPKDAAILSAVCDPMVYVGRPLSISVGLKSSGYAGASSLLVVEEEGRRVAEAPVTLTDGEQEVRFSLAPDRAGRRVYRIHLMAQPAERSVANNTAVVSSEVIENRMRVRIAAGSPSADLAYLRRVLDANENLQVELSVAGKTGDWPIRMRAGLADPDTSGLLILFDLPGEIISGRTGRRLAEYVESGGAMLVVGGRTGFNGAYARSPIARVLPVTCTQDANTYREAPFRLELARSGTVHPILRVSDDPLADRQAWSDLPPLLAFNVNGGLQGAAQSLICHPVERAGGEKMPLVAVRRVGNGKVMAVAARTFWRLGLMMWGVGGNDEVSRAFWANSVQWLVKREDVDRIRVEVDKPVYRSGAAVTFHARVFNELLQPKEGARVAVSVVDEGGVRQTILDDEGQGRYRGQLKAGAQGEYAFEVRALSGGVDLGRATGRFTVGRYSLEFEDMRMNRDLLESVGAQSGGAYAPPERLREVLNGLDLAPQAVAESHRARLWGKPWPLFVLIALLGVEWTARRMRGMI
ncbi:MAG: hypothetical protein OXU79_01650 [Gemmatimonadota bacterium]|nr:hypothetical protein [Gemmatimonadota bacterium]